MQRTTTGNRGGRPMIMARHGVVSAGHYLATEAGMEILRRGGNAADAAAAAGFALTVTKPHANGIAGEVPMLVWSAEQARAWAISGNGTAPAEATIDKLTALGLQIIPGDGFLPAVVPPAVASWILLVRRFGTMRLADVLTPAIELAEEGFGMYESLRGTIADNATRFREQWPGSAKVCLPSGEVPELGAVWRQPDWAATFRTLLAAEAKHTDRDAGMQAAHDTFYRGAIAERIVQFCRANPVTDALGVTHSGFLTVEDFAAYEARVEEPVRSDYRGVTVYKCPPWTQGPVMLQSLNLLEGYDLAAMGHNSADYIHTVVECMKLAYADREFYYGDPDFVDVPMARLLDKGYAADRRRLVDPRVASRELRPDGYDVLSATTVVDVNNAFAAGRADNFCGDTTKVDVIDRAGNMVSATPSGGWLPSSPIIEGLGFPLGTRGQMFSLVAGHPNCLAPRKRPRTSLTPSLASLGGKPYMAFGSPGGDAQDQWALQFLLNVVDFGMSLQEAIEAPTFMTKHFPQSFYPRDAEPGSLYVEGRIDAAIRMELAMRGHRVHADGDWSGGNTLAAAIDPRSGLRHAGASPRMDISYACGW